MYFNNVGMYIHKYKVFLTHALYFNLREVTLQSFPCYHQYLGVGQEPGAKVNFHICQAWFIGESSSVAFLCLCSSVIVAMHSDISNC